MTWEEIKKTLSELTKRSEEVCKQKPSRRQFVDGHLESCLRGLTADSVGLSYGKNQEAFNRFRANLTTNGTELRTDQPKEFIPGKTRHVEHAIDSWNKWLDSLPKKKSFWENLRLVFVGRN